MHLMGIVIVGIATLLIQIYVQFFVKEVNGIEEPMSEPAQNQNDNDYISTVLDILVKTMRFL